MDGHHSMVCTARLTKKPSKAPARTSTSVWPTVSFNGLITFFDPSSASVSKPEDIRVELVCLSLLGDLANRVAFVRLGAGEVSIFDDGFPGWVVDISSPSLQWNRVLESVMFMVFAWLPTSLLTPCKTKDLLSEISSFSQKTHYLAIETNAKNLFLIHLYLETR